MYPLIQVTDVRRHGIPSQGRSRKTQGSGGLPGRTNFSVTASNPPPAPYPCILTSTITYTGQIFNNGCDTGNGNYRSVFPDGRVDQGVFTWSKNCTRPFSETTYHYAWAEAVGMDPTQYAWLAQLNADSDFGGRQVEERASGTGSDGCWFDGSRFDPFDRVTGGGWAVGSPNYNVYGYDVVGYTQAAVDYYRQERPVRGLVFPCSATFNQDMVIRCNSGATLSYQINTLTSVIDTSSISVVRGNGSVTRQW